MHQAGECQSFLFSFFVYSLVEEVMIGALSSFRSLRVAGAGYYRQPDSNGTST